MFLIVTQACGPLINVHLINVLKALFGGQLWGEQFGGHQETGFTVSPCGIVRR